jgi:hypothetical protein
MIVDSDQGVRDLVREGLLSEHDANEVNAFRRFLSVAGSPGDGRIARDASGWVPYCLGLTPPPEGLDGVHVTAWTFPG